jgi:hypothetical protein
MLPRGTPPGYRVGKAGIKGGCSRGRGDESAYKVRTEPPGTPSGTPRAQTRGSGAPRPILPTTLTFFEVGSLLEGRCPHHRGGRGTSPRGTGYTGRLHVASGTRWWRGQRCRASPCSARVRWISTDWSGQRHRAAASGPCELVRWECICVVREGWGLDLKVRKVPCRWKVARWCR